MQAILLLVIEMTAACNYVRKFDYDSFRTGVNESDQNIIPPFCISGGIVIYIQGQSVDGELHE